MSIQSEITRISGNVSDAFTAVTAKGGTVPVGATSDDLATAINSISGGGGSAPTMFIARNTNTSYCALNTTTGGNVFWSAVASRCPFEFEYGVYNPKLGIPGYPTSWKNKYGTIDASYLTIPIAPTTAYSYSHNISQLFSNNSVLSVLPSFTLFNGSTAKPTMTSHIYEMFRGCNNLRSIPNNFLTDVYNVATTNQQIASNMRGDNLFNYCYSLRDVPYIEAAKKLGFYNTLPSSTTINYNQCYYACANCYSADTIKLYVGTAGMHDNNYFVHTFDNCNRVKSIELKWYTTGEALSGNQIVDLTTCGFGYNSAKFYNSGITTAKLVNSTATYNELKDDPDWYAETAEWSRFNSDSLIEFVTSIIDGLSPYNTHFGTIKVKSGAGSGYGKSVNDIPAATISNWSSKGITISYVS